MKFTYEDIKEQAGTAAAELVETAKLRKGDIFVIGCSNDVNYFICDFLKNLSAIPDFIKIF